MVECHYGYNVYANGGLQTSDITAIAGMGGLNVTDLTGTLFGFNNSTGTSNGATMMMTFNSVNFDHAVILTRIESSGTYDYNGNQIMNYHYRDPQNGNSTGVTTAYSGMYSIY